MPDNLPNLSLPLLSPSQSQKHVTHNEALRILDALTQLAVLSETITAPPTDAEDGDRYLVAQGGQDDWAGQDGSIASYEQGAWLFYTPKPGWRIFVQDTSLFKVHDGAGWQTLGGNLLENLSGLGIGGDTSAAPFSAQINAALWGAVYAAAGGNGDLIQTINKETAADDAGFILQTNCSTKAILGLFGTDNLRMAVSADGTSVLDGVVINNATGIVDQPRLPRFTGTTNFDNFAAADAWVKIAINTMQYNDQAAFDAATNLFTAPVDGLYHFGGHLLYKENSSSNARINVRMLKNALDILPGSFGRITSSHVDGKTFVNTHAVVPLVQGDTVELQGKFSSASAYFQADECSFWGYKVG